MSRASSDEIDGVLAAVVAEKNANIQICYVHSCNLLSYFIRVLYCKLVTLSEEYRLEVFECRVQREISGPNRVQVAGDLRKLHNEGLRELYYRVMVNVGRDLKPL
jgi:hypothetical protein